MHYFIFKPIYKERVWGGQKLSSKLQKNIPDNQNIGESWEIVDRPDDQSIVINDNPFKGQALNTLRNIIMGPNWPSEKPFPILVKWLDCNEKLSIQVHPPQNIAEKLNGEPKTENWYILDAEKNANVFLGIKPGVDIQSFTNALKSNTLENLVHSIPTHPNDSIFIPSGRLHAIGAGNLILEIQQNSDTTYRVYDWGRDRELHIQESLQSIDFNDFHPQKTTNQELLANCKEFRIRRFQNQKVTLDHLPAIISVVKGFIQIGPDQFNIGKNILLPYNSKLELNLDKNSIILVTDNFN